MILRLFGVGIDPFDLLSVNDPSRVQAGVTSELLRRGLGPTTLKAAPSALPSTTAQPSKRKAQTPTESSSKRNR